MRTRLLASFALAAALTGSAASAGAQTSSGSEEFDVARGLYADGDFAAAVPHIVAAIQAEPENPRYYLGLARAYYQLHEHDLAVYYYDLYLNELRDLIPGDVRASDRVDRVRDERAGANGLRENSSTSPSGPAAALEARRALLDRMETGPIVGATGGGALSMYEAMLRTGYAHPDLVELRSRMADALLREANATVSDDATALPVLSARQWETQQRRLQQWLALRGDAASGMGDIPQGALDPAAAARLDPATRVRAHLRLCEGQLQYLNQSYRAAAATFAEASTLFPDLVPAYVARLNALVGQGSTLASADEALRSLDRVLSARVPGARGLTEVYRALLVAQAGDYAGAAAGLSQALAQPPHP